MNEEEFNNNFTQEEKIKFLQMKGWLVKQLYSFDYSCDENNEILMSKEEIDKALKEKPEWYAWYDGVDEWTDLDIAWDGEVEAFFFEEENQTLSNEEGIKRIKEIIKKG